MKSLLTKILIFLTILSVIFANETSQSQWMKCSDENSTCNFKGFKMVRYGLEGNFSYKGAYKSIGCNNKEFVDPIVGKSKVCEYSSAEYNWISCGKDGETCKFRGAKYVRFGSGGTAYNYKLATESIECSEKTFGNPNGDPNKLCSYAEEIDPNQFAWGKCADQNGVCKFKGNQVVRYGFDDSWGYITGNTKVNCNDSVFGDSSYGNVKSCQYQLINETVCPDNLYLNGRHCVPKCPSGTFTTADGKKCVVICPSGSLVLEGTSACVNSCPMTHFKKVSNCVQCRPGYKQSLDGIKEVPNCPPDKYVVFPSYLTDEYDSCYFTCPNYFKVYQPRRECYLDCSDAKLLTSADNQFCVDKCPKGELLLGQDCLFSCPTGYLRHNDLCVQTCPEGLLRSADKRECVAACPSGSLLVKAGNKCTYRCPSNTILNGSECVSTCPTGTMPSADNYKCIIGCPKGQFNYKPAGKCFVNCPANLLVNGNECVDVCPDDKYLSADKRNCVVDCPEKQFSIAAHRACYYICPLNFKASGNKCICQS